MDNVLPASYKRSRPLWLLIGARKLFCSSAQSEGSRPNGVVSCVLTLKVNEVQLFAMFIYKLSERSAARHVPTRLPFRAQKLKNPVEYTCIILLECAEPFSPKLFISKVG